MAMIAVIVPAFNEEENVPRVARAVHEELQRNDIPHQLLFVDDGSTDGTWQTVQRLARRHDWVGGVRLSRNFGKESAIVAGLDRVQADAAVIMDADLQHPAAVIPQMVEQWQGGAYIVHGQKRTPSHAPLRRLGTALFYGLTQRLSGISVHGSSDFKLLDRRVVEVYRSQLRERNRFFRVTAEWIGFPRAYVEFDVQGAADRRSRWTVGSLARLAIRGLTTFSSLPLQLATAAGALLLLAAPIAAAVAWSGHLQDAPGAGHWALAALVLLVGALDLLSQGILGEYVATIHEEVKRRPIYVVQQQTSTVNPVDAARGRGGDGHQHDPGEASPAAPPEEPANGASPEGAPPAKLP